MRQCRQHSSLKQYERNYLKYTGILQIAQSKVISINKIFYYGKCILT